MASGYLAIARHGDDDHLAEVAHALNWMEELVDDLSTLVHGGERVSEVETADLASVVAHCWRNVATTERAPAVDAHGWSVALTERGAGGTRFDITGVERESRAPAPS